MIRVDQLTPGQIPHPSRADVGKLTMDGQLDAVGKRTPMVFNQTGYINWQAIVFGAGSVGAVVELYGSNNGIFFHLVDTLTVAAGMQPVVAGNEMPYKTWPFIYAQIKTLTGTAKVDVFVQPQHPAA